MFCGRLPDQFLHTSSVPDEAASFEARVEQQEPLRGFLQALWNAKRELTNKSNRPLTGF